MVAHYANFVLAIYTAALHKLKAQLQCACNSAGYFLVVGGYYQQFHIAFGVVQGLQVHAFGVVQGLQVQPLLVR